MFRRPFGAFRLVSVFPRLKPWAKFQGPAGAGEHVSVLESTLLNRMAGAARHHAAGLIFPLS